MYSHFEGDNKLFLNPLRPDFFYSFYEHSLRKALFDRLPTHSRVYRLIVATLIGNFLVIPF